MDKETGEYLLSGMGELHLEVAINQLKSLDGIDVAVSSPRVVHMESVQKKGVVALARSPNKQSSFCIQVMPEAEEQANPSADDDVGNVLSIDEHRNVLIDIKGKTEQTVSEEALEAIIAGFEYACRAGPLCGEPMRHVKVNLVDLQLCETEAAFRNYAWRRQSGFRQLPNRRPNPCWNPSTKSSFPWHPNCQANAQGCLAPDAAKSPALSRKGS